jgi:arylsulfatase A-like enzyme
VRRPPRAALALLLSLGTGACQRSQRPPDVLLITIDTLRPDHLGAYGYPRATSPHIDRLAARSTLFEHAVAQAPHTIPSMLQIMSSRYAGGLEIAPEQPTLAEVLQARGYATWAVVENAHFEQHKEAHGLRRGFERFYRNGVLSRESLAVQMYKTDSSADALTAQALRVLRQPRGNRPFFLWIHYFDPHDPYLPPFDDEMDRLSQSNPSPMNGDVRATPLMTQSRDAPATLPEADRQHLIELYDAEIRHVDQSLGELLSYLEDQRILDRALVVLAADHGESLGEHGIWTHGRSGFDPELRIPLLVKLPRQMQAERRAGVVQAIDIFPTVLDALGLPRSGLPLEGRSLLRPHDEPAFTFWKEWQVVHTPEWKLVQQGESLRLYRIDEDPGETRDVRAQFPAKATELLQARKRRLQAMGRSAADLQRESSEAVERLRALGYLGP